MARVLLAKARYIDVDVDPPTPPLGVMYLASVLRRAGHEVWIFEAGERYRPDDFRRRIRELRPDVIGVSAITIEGLVMEAMVQDARATRPEATVVVGGPHPTAYPDHCARLPSVDYVVLGEGEETIVELVEAIGRSEREPRHVAGLVFRDGAGEIVHTASRPNIEDLDALPFPAWDLVDLDFYARHRAMSGAPHGRYMALFTSRGCPFKCIYCHDVQGKRFRARSPANVLAEITELRERYGIREFEVIDDIFNFKKSRTIDILDGLLASPHRVRLHFPNALRTDLLDADQIDRLRRAGTHTLCVAVETVSTRLQKLSKKHLDVDRVAHNIDLAVDAGLFVRGFFMLGFPTETYPEARATVDFAVGTRLHEAFFFIATPYGGTTLFEVYQQLRRERGLPELEFHELSFSDGSVNVSDMSDTQLYSLQREAYRRFYVDPRRAVRILARKPSLGLLTKGAMRVAHYVVPKRLRKSTRPPLVERARPASPAPHREAEHADGRRRLPVVGA